MSAYPGLPAIVLMDGTEYRIVVISDDVAFTEDGEYDVRNSTIKLRADMAVGYARVIVVHEILHAIWEHRGFTAEGRVAPTEEEVVSALAYGLVSLVRQNPSLMAWLTGEG